MRTDHVFEDLVPLTARPNGDQVIRPRNFDCLKQAITQYEKFCGKMSDYDLKYVRQLVNLCETLPAYSDTPALLKRIEDACEH